MLTCYRYLRRCILSFFVGFSLLLAHIAFVHAHDGSAVLGDPRSFTGVAIVSCFDDGNGPAENLIARIRDHSPAIPGLLTNLHIFKGNQAISISDTIPGDADYSPYVTLHQGPGAYFVIVSKTDVGDRAFDLEYHCQTVDGVHTGTEIGVTQFGEPAMR